MVLASLRIVVNRKMRFVAQNVDASRVRGRREQQSQSSLPGIARRKTRVNALMSPQVGFTRLAAHYTAQLGRARVAVQSILFAKKFLRRGWTRGSSPRVTEGLRGARRVRGRREPQSQSSLPGLTRQSILCAKIHPLRKEVLTKRMDPRVKPAGDR